ncbi:MAG TPA: serine/threonine protein kinase, partial [Candidatus Scatomorpha merdipullorum]|nr:serine/threonine protein kinase [Candidatus Scatomorpha merdipullorum]
DVSVRIGPAQQEYEKGLRRFLQEARTLARMVKQPQIVMVHDFFEANAAYSVMYSAEA